MEALLRCKVLPGQFSTEYAVEGEQVNREKFSLFAPDAYVTTEMPPTRDRSVDGWLRVVIWERQGDTAVVKLPRESFESGRFVTVGVAQLQIKHQPVEA
jgi:hypothetical protein